MTTAGGDPARRPPQTGRGSRDGVPLGALAGLGAQFAAALVLFGYLGARCDRRWHSDPWGLLAGVFLGGGGVFFISYRRVMAQGTELDGRSPHDTPPGDR